jgi:hypothetical protein
VVAGQTFKNTVSHPPFASPPPLSSLLQFLKLISRSDEIFQQLRLRLVITIDSAPQAYRAEPLADRIARIEISETPHVGFD